MKQYTTSLKHIISLYKRFWMGLVIICLVVALFFFTNSAQSRAHQKGQIPLSTEQSHLWIVGLDDDGKIENTNNIEKH